MPLTLDATPGGAASNSYATAAEATALALYRIGANAAAWAALTSDQKIQALVTATREIDSIGTLREDDFIVSFPGDKTDEDQALEWPRDGETTLPADLVSATIELALFYVPTFAAGYTGDPLNLDSSSARVKRKKVDVLETEWFEPGAGPTSLERFPGIVLRLLEKLLVYTPFGSGVWGSGTAVRGS